MCLLDSFNTFFEIISSLVYDILKAISKNALPPLWEMGFLNVFRVRNDDTIIKVW